MTHHSTPIERLSKANIESLLSLGISADDDAGIASCAPLFDALRDDQTQQLMSDLRQKLFDDRSGPLSFQRLVPSEHLQAEAGRSFLDVLTDKSPTSDSLDAIIAYGRILIQEGMPQNTRRAGAALLAGAKTALAMHFGRDMSDAVRQISQKVHDVIH